MAALRAAFLLGLTVVARLVQVLIAFTRNLMAHETTSAPYGALFNGTLC